MDILLSWSGQASHDISLALRDWLREVLPGCTPWVSSEDIAKGKRWSDVLHDQLDRTKVTIVCITPENVKSPWLYYEAGFIAAKKSEASVCPYLVGVSGKLIGGTPLGQYQWTEADKTDTLKLIRSLHEMLQSPHDIGMLEGNFQAKWPQLKRKLDKIAEAFEEVEDEIAQTETPLSQRMSEEAKQLLMGACGSGNQDTDIVCSQDFEGFYIHAGEKNWTVPADARSVATWKAALNELEQFGLVASPDYAREIFEITRKGWEVYDQIKPLQSGP